MNLHRGPHQLLIALATLVLLAGCAVVPLDGDNQPSYRLPAADANRIALRLQQEGQQPLPEGISAARLQATGYQAWEDRLRLIQLADESLDIQYFTWDADESGLVLMSHVIDAADRGVRVRILIDDMMAVDQHYLVKIAAHDNIDVRMFNPFSTQRIDVLIRPFEWLAKERVNVRMHNKVLVADSLVGIVGGRNIENRYFWIDGSFNHRDLDAVVIGAVLPDLQLSFDKYWNSTWAVPIERLEVDVKQRKARKYYRAMRKFREREDIAEHFTAMGLVDLSEYRISEGMVRARAQFIADDPDKVTTREPQQFNHLDALVDQYAHEQLLVGMAYVVPTRPVMAQFERLAQRGVDVRILTNSMVSIDFPAAFSGYEVARKQLIDLGVSMYEFSADAGYAECPVSCVDIHMGYHPKIMVFDRAVSYVGSMNYDPRSIDLNTEAGLVFYSEELAQQVADYFFEDAGTRNSWLVTHASPLRWSRPRPDGSMEVMDDEPDASVLNKIGVKFWRAMPLADQY